MEYIVIIVISIIFLLILKYAWNIKIKDIKKLKEIGYDKTLNEITNKLPENREICKTILKKLNNENVNIKEELEEENRNTKRKDGNNKNITIAKEKNLNKEDEKNKKATASLYIAITSTIFIADVKNTFTRVQTIVHECLHSVQNRRTLLFNFIFSINFLISIFPGNNSFNIKKSISLSFSKSSNIPSWYCISSVTISNIFSFFNF